MNDLTLLLYKLNKYQNKLGHNPNSIIYQQKYAYYTDLIGGGGKSKHTVEPQDNNVIQQNILEHIKQKKLYFNDLLKINGIIYNEKKKNNY